MKVKRYRMNNWLFNVIFDLFLYAYIICLFYLKNNFIYSNLYDKSKI